MARPKKYPTARGIVLEAIIAVAECDAESSADRAEWERAWSRFWQAVEAAGWQRKDNPPRAPECTSG